MRNNTTYHRGSTVTYKLFDVIIYSTERKDWAPIVVFYVRVRATRVLAGLSFVVSCELGLELQHAVKCTMLI